MGIRPTFFGIEIGKSGLTVAQKGLDVTGHNISNVETAGYTRQRIMNTAYAPYSAITQLRIADNGRVGAGAHVQILDQIRSAFLDRQFRTEQTAASYWSTRSQGLSYVQSLFETSTGELALTTSVNDLFSAFNQVTNAPEDQQQRTFLRQQALKMTEQFKHMYESMMALQEGQNTSVKTVTDPINTIAGQIADLNKNIFAFEIDGQPANDLRDKRNLLVDQLAGLADVTYEGDAIGSKFSLSIGGKTLGCL
jgi:flagellar hook-associated protein 1 FlgK